MFTEQILKSILSLKSFASPASKGKPGLAGVHISVDGDAKTITAMATDSYAIARMVIAVPEVTGESWERNVSIATLNAALATVKANGQPVSAFPESYMPEFPTAVAGIVDRLIDSEAIAGPHCFNAKYLGALSKVNVGGDKSGRWAIRTVDRYDHAGALVATATYGLYDVTVVAIGRRD